MDGKGSRAALGGLLVYERCVGGKIKTNDESELCLVKDVSLLVPNSLELNKRTRYVSALLNADLNLEKRKETYPFSEPMQEPLSASKGIVISSLPYIPTTSS